MESARSTSAKLAYTPSAPEAPPALQECWEHPEEPRRARSIMMDASRYLISQIIKIPLEQPFTTCCPGIWESPKAVE
jgi:hypothetical protein